MILLKHEFDICINALNTKSQVGASAFLTRGRYVSAITPQETKSALPHSPRLQSFLHFYFSSGPTAVKPVEGL
jgi:hypothetical protein